MDRGWEIAGVWDWAPEEEIVCTSIWVVRFFNSSQLLAGPGCPEVVVVVVLNAPPFVSLLHPLSVERPIAVRLVPLELVGS